MLEVYVDGVLCSIDIYKYDSFALRNHTPHPHSRKSSFGFLAFGELISLENMQRLLPSLIALHLIMMLNGSFKCEALRRELGFAFFSSLKRPNDKLQRVERILANRGLGSRSEVNKMIHQGRIKINGKVVRSSSERVSSQATIYVDHTPCDKVCFPK